MAGGTEIGAAVGGARVFAVSIGAVVVERDGVGGGASSWSLATRRSHPCEFALPPCPDLALEGIAAFPSVERAGGADAAGHAVSGTERGGSPAVVRPAGEPVSVECSERPCVVERGRDQDPRVEVPGVEAQPGAGGEGVVGACLLSVGELR